jgi:hypothetical protein
MASEVNDGGAAFPRTGMLLQDELYEYPQDGMSLRDWFAVQAMAGLLASNATYGGRTDNRVALAADAYAIADAMLAESRKGVRDE